jgi:hypothetical protein
MTAMPQITQARGKRLLHKIGLGRSRLRDELLAVIALKIIFLVVFWNVVLSKQAVHIDQEDMAPRIISQRQGT